jgi:hypothetical protein
LQLLHPVATHRKLPLSFVADVSANQSAWEQSGKFEGDIMLPEEQLRNGMINPASRWPNRVATYVIDDVFSKYCSTKLQSGLGGVLEIIHALLVLL